jgi:amino acid transporter
VANDPESNVVLNLSSVTAFLLLCVFTVVNVACMILRRDHPEKTFFTSPGPTPLVAAALCLFLAGPWVDRDPVVYEIAGWLMLIGVVLWIITFFINKATGTGDSDFEDVGHLGG